MKYRYWLTTMTLAGACLSSGAENWPQWRVFIFNGATTEKSLPASFSKTENVAWSADLPGPSAATPVTWGDKVFLSSTDRTAQKLVALCFSRQDGKLLWKEV